MAKRKGEQEFLPGTAPEKKAVSGRMTPARLARHAAAKAELAEMRALKRAPKGRHGVKCPVCGRNYANGYFLKLHLRLKSCSDRDLMPGAI
jgi:hypothetical protein